MVEFMQQGTTIMSELYCKTLKKLLRTIPNKSRGVLLHDSAHLHTAVRTRALLEHFNTTCFTCTYLKNWLRSWHFNNNEGLMEGVKVWLISQAADDLLDRGIQKLIPQFYKCLIFSSDHVEK
jgi:hypothetical protein